MSAILCPYCGKPATLLEDSSPIYRGTNFGPVFICWPCEAWVGVHKGTHKPLIDEDDVNTREYAKYLLREGSTTEKRELLANLRSRLMYKDKKITLVRE